LATLADDGSLSGGPLFLGPLHTASVLPAIMSNICPSNNPPQVVLSALRALSNLADSVTLASGVSILNASTLADCLFSHPCINSLCKILSQSSAAPDIQSQISQAASLISRLCRDERHQSSLSNGGVLEALAIRLASVIVSQGLVIPGAEILAHKEGQLDNFPPPAPQNTDIAGILEAIAVIIADSKFRASQLVYSHAIMAVFPTTSPVNFQPNQYTKAAWAPFNAADLGSRQSQLNALDYLIPYVPLNRTKSASALSSAFPPLGTPSSFEHLVHMGGSRIPTWSHPSSLDAGVPSQDNISTDISEPESPLIAYLIWLTRSTQDLERLMAAFVLTVLFKAGLTSKSRESALGLLIVPILVQLLRDEKSGSRTHVDKVTNAAERTSVEWKIRERAPAVLAMLIVDSEYLQKSAYDAGVIKRLSELIKTAYDPALDGSHYHTWSPITGSNFDSNSLSASHASRLEQAGLSPLLVHRIKVRESTLRAIAALVPFKDEYRKALIDHGIVPYVVESLKTYPGRPSMKPNEKSEKPNQLGEDNKFTSQEFGTNPIPVLIAACGAVRHLSRSVSILRTTLIDNGVVMPVFALLQHSDIDVQISATAATCNLVMDFSPMREVNRY
jgi:armadillo repeat-containing protein 8